MANYTHGLPMQFGYNVHYKFFTNDTFIRLFVCIKCKILIINTHQLIYKMHIPYSLNAFQNEYDHFT